MELLNNFNGASLAIIMMMSYWAVLKNTKRSEQKKSHMFSRHYQ
ncbi:MAG: hypothetical protein RL551_772 [Pseudomonadota bacterium]|jgi:hypothetical protein|nr:hypothetical protein [Polynucleobacter sp. AP-Jannik-300A-C4]